MYRSPSLDTIYGDVANSTRPSVAFNTNRVRSQSIVSTSYTKLVAFSDEKTPHDPYDHPRESSATIAAISRSTSIPNINQAVQRQSNVVPKWDLACVKMGWASLRRSLASAQGASSPGILFGTTNDKVGDNVTGSVDHATTSSTKALELETGDDGVIVKERAIMGEVGDFERNLMEEIDMFIFREIVADERLNFVGTESVASLEGSANEGEHENDTVDAEETSVIPLGTGLKISENETFDNDIIEAGDRTREVRENEQAPRDSKDNTFVAANVAELQVSIGDVEMFVKATAVMGEAGDFEKDLMGEIDRFIFGETVASEPCIFVATENVTSMEAASAGEHGEEKKAEAGEDGVIPLVTELQNETFDNDLVEVGDSAREVNDNEGSVEVKKTTNVAEQHVPRKEIVDGLTVAGTELGVEKSKKVVETVWLTSANEDIAKTSAKFLTRLMTRWIDTQSRQSARAGHNVDQSGPCMSVPETSTMLSANVLQEIEPTVVARSNDLATVSVAVDIDDAQDGETQARIDEGFSVINETIASTEVEGSLISPRKSSAADIDTNSASFDDDGQSSRNQNALVAEPVATVTDMFSYEATTENIKEAFDVIHKAITSVDEGIRARESKRLLLLSTAVVTSGVQERVSIAFDLDNVVVEATVQKSGLVKGFEVLRDVPLSAMEDETVNGLRCSNLNKDHEVEMDVVNAKSKELVLEEALARLAAAEARLVVSEALVCQLQKENAELQLELAATKDNRLATNATTTTTTRLVSSLIAINTEDPMPNVEITRAGTLGFVISLTGFDHSRDQHDLVEMMASQPSPPMSVSSNLPNVNNQSMNSTQGGLPPGGSSTASSQQQQQHSLHIVRQRAVDIAEWESKIALSDEMSESIRRLQEMTLEQPIPDE
ncbi:hypothetical protein HDU76_006512, partial [Blyttiomyces sp. JEL0837]